MKKTLFTIIALLAIPVLSFAADESLTVTPSNPKTTGRLVITYTPQSSQAWMKSQPVYLYACVEFNENGEWAKEKSSWAQCNVPANKFNYDSESGRLTYQISDIKSFFNLTSAEFEQVSGIFVILKNDNYQTSDKYIKLYNASANTDKFNGTVKFSVTVPAGTQSVYVAGTFGPEGSDGFWKHADPKHQLKKVSDTKFEGTFSNVPADLEYLYVWGPRVDQTEFRLSERPLGSRSKVNDIVEYWGDLTLNVTVPDGTKEVYIAGSFNNWTPVKMDDSGNNSWTYHVAPGMIGNADAVDYKYYKSKDVSEKGKNRHVKFEGFSTQYDEINAW